MPYRTRPRSCTTPATLTVSLAWGTDCIAVRHLLRDGAAGVGDVAGSLGPIPCDALGVPGFTFATLARDVAQVHIPAGAVATLCRTGGPAMTVDGPMSLDLGPGDECAVVVGDFTLRALGEAREAAPQLRAWRSPLWLAPVAAAAALHAAALFVVPRAAERHGDGMGNVDVGALRAMLGGDKPGPGHDVDEAVHGPPVHAEEVEPPPAEALEVEHEPPPRSPAPKAKSPADSPVDSHRDAPAPAAEHARRVEPTTGAIPAPPGHPGEAEGKSADSRAAAPPPAAKRRTAQAAKKAGQRVFSGATSEEPLPVTGEDPRLCFLGFDLKPMPWVRYQITTESGETRTGIAGRNGAAVLRGMKTPLRGKAQWGRRHGDYEWAGTFVIFGVSRGETAGEQRDAAEEVLRNLGFGGSSLEERLRAFQAREGQRVKPPLAVTGQLDLRTWELLWKLHDGSCQ